MRDKIRSTVIGPIMELMVGKEGGTRTVMLIALLDDIWLRTLT